MGGVNWGRDTGLSIITGWITTGQAVLYWSRDTRPCKNAELYSHGGGRQRLLWRLQRGYGYGSFDIQGRSRGHGGTGGPNTLGMLHRWNTIIRETSGCSTADPHTKAVQYSTPRKVQLVHPLGTWLHLGLDLLKAVGPEVCLGVGRHEAQPPPAQDLSPHPP